MIASVREYFRLRMKSLDGWHEHKDPFNYQNIPESVLDKAFHIKLGQISQESNNQRDLSLNVPVDLRAFLKGYADVNARYDLAAKYIDDILSEIMDPANRLTQTNGLKTIALGSASIIPLEVTNDNSMIIEMVFNTKVIICP